MIQSWKHQQFTWKEGDRREPVSHFCTSCTSSNEADPGGCSAVGQVTWSVQPLQGVFVPLPVFTSPLCYTRP